MAGTPGSLEVVCFDAGGVHLAVEARQVRGMLATAEGNTDVVAVEDVIGLPRNAPARRKWLLIGAQNRCVEVSAPVELMALPACAIYPLPPLAAARMSLTGVRAAAFLESGLVLIVDLEAALSRFSRTGG
jgi:hypothetical protein